MGEPVTTAAAISAGAGIAGGLMGADQAKGARNDANNARNAALAQFAGISLPDLEAMKLNPELFTSAGNLTPEMIQLITQADTDLANITTDPRLRQAQLDALEDTEYVANMGMSPADKAAFELALRNSRAEGQAKTNQIMQNMAQRGVGGSGAELAAQLQTAQSQADQANVAGLEQAKQAQAARMAALQQQANMAGSLRSADYSEAANEASARDAIARFNAQNAQNVTQTNAGARNSAQASNLQNAQNIRNQNTTTNNTAQQYNKQLQQQQFQNQMNLASNRANVLQGNAAAADQRAGQTAGMWSGIGQGVGTIAGAYANQKPTAGVNTQSLPKYNPATGQYES